MQVAERPAAHPGGQGGVQPADVCSWVFGKDVYKRQVLDNARGFDQSLREQVSGLQASVQQATDLNSLKLAVDSRLNGLLASMDEHQREQAEHEQEVSGRLQALMRCV